MSRSSAPSGLFGYSLQERLANVIARLVAQELDEARLAAAASVIADAEPLSFALECLRALRRRETETQLPPLDGPTLDKLQSALADRIVGTLKPEAPLWDSEPLWTTLLYVAARGSRGDEVRSLVTSWLKDPDAVDTLLTGLAGKATNLGTGDVVQQDFTTETLETLRGVADPDAVRAAVRGRYGELLVDSYPPDASYVRDSTRAVIEQFWYLDSKATAAVQPGSAADSGGDIA